MVGKRKDMIWMLIYRVSYNHESKLLEYMFAWENLTIRFTHELICLV